MKRREPKKKIDSWKTKKKRGRIKHHLIADIYTFKLDKHSHKQVHKRFVVCGSLSRSDSKLAG